MKTLQVLVLLQLLVVPAITVSLTLTRLIILYYLNVHVSNKYFSTDGNSKEHLVQYVLYFLTHVPAVMLFICHKAGLCNL